VTGTSDAGVKDQEAVMTQMRKLVYAINTTLDGC
jgi:hypothetical protein